MILLLPIWDCHSRAGTCLNNARGGAGGGPLCATQQGRVVIGKLMQHRCQPVFQVLRLEESLQQGRRRRARPDGPRLSSNRAPRG